MTHAADSKHSFFRQSGWMMFATTASGLFMFGVHFYAPLMSGAEYGLFQTLLTGVLLMMVPALGLQAVFAQQAAAVRNEDGQRQLTGTARALFKWTFVIWLVMAAVVIIFRRTIMSVFTIPNPVAIWVTLLIGLLQLWLPIVLGLLQGSQNFLWYGWVFILNGVARFIAVGVAVALLKMQATGAIVGALIGFVVAFGLGGWQCRETLFSAWTPFANWRSWVRRVLPLTIGLGITYFVLSADMLAVRSLFDPEQTGYYAFSGMMGRGIVLFTAPLTAVMFPKLVRSFALSENNNVLAQALGATAALGAAAAAGCTLVAALIPYGMQVLATAKAPMLAGLYLKVSAKADMLNVVHRLVPWCVWGMLPLALANVLISSLLAQERYRVVPWLLVVVGGYLTALSIFHQSMLVMILNLTGANLALLAVTFWFTWGPGGKKTQH